MRTPVVVLAGQGDTAAVARSLLQRDGTVVVSHRFDGQVIVRTVTTNRCGVLTTSEAALELARCCVACAITEDVVVLLRKLHRRAGVRRVVVQLARWLEPEPICRAIEQVRVGVGPGFIDGPAARDVWIAGVVTCLDVARWMGDALGEDTLDDGRPVAQVVVGQAAFADVLVVPGNESTIVAVLGRLAPDAHVVAETEAVDDALSSLGDRARRGRCDSPHGPLLAGEPSLDPDGRVAVVEFSARRPFHPRRLPAALDLLLDGVIRVRGRLWLATRPQHVMWLESAGGGLRYGSAGKWVAAMTDAEFADVDPERRAFASLMWDNVFGDRHSAMVIVTCGASRADVVTALNAALLADDEMRCPGTWGGYRDPFGDWHLDSCGQSAREEAIDEA